jgi:hypothetical protein
VPPHHPYWEQQFPNVLFKQVLSPIPLQEPSVDTASVPVVALLFAEEEEEDNEEELPQVPNAD